MSRTGAISNGVGLKISKKICEQLDGDLKVESTLGKGSIFTFTMLVEPYDASLTVINEEANSSQESEIEESRPRPSLYKHQDD